MVSSSRSALARWGIVASLAGFALGLRTARAAEASETTACATPAPEATNAAKGLFREGQAAFNEGAYDLAITLWTRAYEADCTAHGLLLNLALAQELLGRPVDAVQALERFNVRSPGSPYVAANEKRIAVLRRQALEQSRARALAVAERRRRDAPPRVIHVVPERAPFESSTLALILAATGGAAAVAGAALYAEGRATAASAAGRCEGGPARCTDPDAVITGERARARAELAGWIACGGLVTLGGGLAWYFSTPAPAVPSRGVEWGASISPAGAEVLLGGRF